MHAVVQVQQEAQDCSVVEKRVFLHHFLELCVFCVVVMERNNDARVSAAEPSFEEYYLWRGLLIYVSEAYLSGFFQFVDAQTTLRFHERESHQLVAQLLKVRYDREFSDQALLLDSLQGSADRRLRDS